MLRPLCAGGFANPPAPPTLHPTCSFLKVGFLLSLGYKFGILGGGFAVSPPATKSYSQAECIRKCSAVAKTDSINEIFKAGAKVIATTALADGGRSELK